MQLPYETPEKRALRARATVALEASGFALRQEARVVALPAEFGQNARISGDVQAENAGGRLEAFYLWVDGSRALTGWIESIARGSHAVDEDVAVFVIAVDPSDTLKGSCEAAGAGLFALRDDDTLELLVDPAAFGEAERVAAVRKRAGDLRRRAGTKARMEQNRVDERYASVQGLVAAMDQEERERWTRGVEESANQVADWVAQVADLIEQGVTDTDASLLDAAEALIVEGPFS